MSLSFGILILNIHDEVSYGRLIVINSKEIVKCLYMSPIICSVEYSSWRFMVYELKANYL